MTIRDMTQVPMEQRVAAEQIRSLARLIERQAVRFGQGKPVHPQMWSHMATWAEMIVTYSQKGRGL